MYIGMRLEVFHVQIKVVAFLLLSEHFVWASELRNVVV